MISLCKKCFATALLLLICVVPVPASIPEPPAVPRDYVIDLANVIKDEVKSGLSADLQELEKKTSAQVLVLTVVSLEGERIEDFSLKTAKQWGLGQKGRDNGILIVVAVNDRRYRFEVGYGLETVLPDSMVGSIGREYFVHSFKRGDFSAGIQAATLEVARTISSNRGVPVSLHRMSVKDETCRLLQRFHDEYPNLSFAIFFVLFMSGFFGGFFLLALLGDYGEQGERPNHRRKGWNKKGRFHTVSSFGDGGGSFGGSDSSGSFDGGGGGDFGGGGASGSW